MAHGVPGSFMAARAPWSTIGPGMGTALEATCPVSMSLEASRAPIPPPRCYGAGCAVWEGEVMSRSPVELHCISQHPSGHSPALHHNHSHLTSISETSSPVATNQALYITALNPDTRCGLEVTSSSSILSPTCWIPVAPYFTHPRLPLHPVCEKEKIFGK